MKSNNLKMIFVALAINFITCNPKNQTSQDNKAARLKEIKV